MNRYGTRTEKHRREREAARKKENKKEAKRSRREAPSNASTTASGSSQDSWSSVETAAPFPSSVPSSTSSAPYSSVAPLFDIPSLKETETSNSLRPHEEPPLPVESAVNAEKAEEAVVCTPEFLSITTSSLTEPPSDLLSENTDWTVTEVSWSAERMGSPLSVDSAPSLVPSSTSSAPYSSVAPLFDVPSLKETEATNSQLNARIEPAPEATEQPFGLSFSSSYDEFVFCPGSSRARIPAQPEAAVAEEIPKVTRGARNKNDYPTMKDILSDWDSEKVHSPKKSRSLPNMDCKEEEEELAPQATKSASILKVHFSEEPPVEIHVSFSLPSTRVVPAEAASSSILNMRIFEEPAPSETNSAISLNSEIPSIIEESSSSPAPTGPFSMDPASDGHVACSDLVEESSSEIVAASPFLVDPSSVKSEETNGALEKPAEPVIFKVLSEDSEGRMLVLSHSGTVLELHDAKTLHSDDSEFEKEDEEKEEAEELPSLENNSSSILNTRIFEELPLSASKTASAVASLTVDSSSDRALPAENASSSILNMRIFENPSSTRLPSQSSSLLVNPGSLNTIHSTEEESSDVSARPATTESSTDSAETLPIESEENDATHKTAEGINSQPCIITPPYSTISSGSSVFSNFGKFKLKDSTLKLQVKYDAENGDLAVFIKDLHLSGFFVEVPLKASVHVAVFPLDQAQSSDVFDGLCFSSQAVLPSFTFQVGGCADSLSKTVVEATVFNHVGEEKKAVGAVKIPVGRMDLRLILEGADFVCRLDGAVHCMDSEETILVPSIAESVDNDSDSEISLCSPSGSTPSTSSSSGSPLSSSSSWSKSSRSARSSSRLVDGLEDLLVDIAHLIADAKNLKNCRCRR